MLMRAFTYSEGGGEVKVKLSLY